MIGLDPNVLVRYITQDDPVQSAAATELIESLSVVIPGFISMVTIVELVWVLQQCYPTTKAEIVQVISTLLRTKELAVENAEIVWQALRRFTDAKADFADCLIERSAHAAGCKYTMTLDPRTSNTAGMRQLA